MAKTNDNTNPAMLGETLKRDVTTRMPVVKTNKFPIASSRVESHRWLAKVKKYAESMSSMASRSRREKYFCSPYARIDAVPETDSPNRAKTWDRNTAS